MGKTIYLSKPQTVSLLYNSYPLYFTLYDGVLYNPNKMKITKVTYEFRCYVLNNPNKFGFTRTGSQTDEDLITNKIQTNYYSSTQNTYFTNSIDDISLNFHKQPFQGTVEAMESLLAKDGENFQVYFTQFGNTNNNNNTSSAKISAHSKIKEENIPSYIRSDAWVCTVEWEYIPQSPTPPTKIGTSQNNLGTTMNFLGAQTLDLYWSGAAGGSDEDGEDIGIQNYKITRAGTDESWTSSNAYYSFECHPDLQGEYEYRIYTRNTKGILSDTYLSVTISTYYTSPTKPTDIKIDGVSIAYIGKQEVPSSLKLTWKPGTNGVNNIIKRYRIYKDNNDEPVATIECDNSSVSYSYTLGNPGAGIYTVSSIGAVNNTEVISDAVEIRVIDAPTSPIPVESSIASMDNTIVLTWSSVSHNSAQGNLSYILSESNKVLKEGYFTSYSYDASKVASNTPIKFSVKARINAKNGGYIDSDDSIITYTKIGSFSFPTDASGNSTFWRGLAETTGSTPETLNKDVFSQVSVAWASLIETGTAPGRTSFTYELQYRLSTTSNWITLVNTDNTAYFGADISTAEEGAEIGFQIVATDNYGLSLTSPILTATKIKRPLITKVSASNISYAYFQANFSIQGQVENEDINYNIYLKYNGINCAIANTGATIENNVLEINSFNRGLNISIAGKAAETGWSDLYEDVINNKISMPYISFVVEASYDKFPGCKTVQESATFQANYRNAPVRKENLATFNITKISGPFNTGAYYNPNDTFKATLATNNFSWKDAAGGTTGGEITYKIISSYSKKSYNFDQPIVVPSVTKDELVTFTMEATVTYSDGAITYKYSENQPSITVAKWFAEQTYIQDFTKVWNGYEGYLVLPDSLCSSLAEKNLNLLVFTTNFNNKVTNGSSIINGTPEGAMKDKIIFYYDQNGNGSWASINEWNIAGSTLYNLSGTNNRKIKFTIKSSETSCDFFIETTWTNTSGHSLIITTPTVTHITAAADFAIRKGRIGVNIGENFGKEDSNVGLSTVEINHSSNIQKNGNILTLDGSNSGCEAFICLRGANGVKGTITQDTTNNQFVFSDNFRIGSNYSLPIASADILGGVKIGSGIDIDDNGTISVKITEYNLPTASKDILGGVTTTSIVVNSSGYTACPIIDGVVYYKETTLPEIEYPVTSVNNKVGAVVLQASDIGGFSKVATSGSYNDLKDKPTIPTVNYPVTSVNGKSGAITLTHSDVGAAYKNHTHNLSELNGVATFRLEGATLHITTNIVAG